MKIAGFLGVRPAVELGRLRAARDVLAALAKEEKETRERERRKGERKARIDLVKAAAVGSWVDPFVWCEILLLFVLFIPSIRPDCRVEVPHV